MLRRLRAGLTPTIATSPPTVVSSLTLAAGVLATVFAWTRAGQDPVSASSLLIAVYLAGAVVLAHRLPIHARHATVIYVSTGCLFLMAALLPPPIAAISAGVGKLLGELTVRGERGTHASDIVTQTGRYMLCVLLASLVAHGTDGRGSGSSAVLIVTAGVLWGADILTSPLLFTPVTGEAPHRVVLSLVRETGFAESVQYFMGVLVALAVRQEIWTLALLAVPTGLVYGAFKRATQLDEAAREMLERMADTVDLRDPYTGGHSRRVTELTRGILEELQVGGPEAALIVLAARIHDIGKIGVPDEVLKKAGPLTPAEWEIMREHPVLGADLLSRYPGFERGVEIVRHHHERWDGGGYPDRLKGTAIPFGARVVAVADAYDAMTGHRPYRPGMAPHVAREILAGGRGVQWDSPIVDAFLRRVPEAVWEPTPPRHTQADIGSEIALEA